MMLNSRRPGTLMRSVSAQATSRPVSARTQRNGNRTAPRREYSTMMRRHRDTAEETIEVEPSTNATATVTSRSIPVPAPSAIVSAPLRVTSTSPAAITAAADGTVTNFQGIVPQTSIIPAAVPDSFRTSWTGEAAVGKGFVRETNQFKPTAVLFGVPEGEEPIEVSEEPDRILFLKERFSVVTSAKEQAKELSVGAGVSVEAYGASLSGSMELNSNTEVSSNAVTVNLLRSYKSDPILIADPISNPFVRLSERAKTILSELGPEKFQQKFGTHFVAGFTVGGLFSGFVQVVTQNSSDALAIKGQVEASIPLGPIGEVSGEANVDFSEQFNNENSSTRTSYSAIGWNKQRDENGVIKPPNVVRSYEEMIEAANDMEIDDGQRLEAILIAYEDLPDFQENLPTVDSFKTLEKGKFSTISALLSQEFIALDFLRKAMDNTLLNADLKAGEALGDANPIEDVEDLRQRAFLLQQNITARFSSDANARNSWFALDEYIAFFRFLKLSMPDAEYDPDIPLVPGEEGPDVPEVPVEPEPTASSDLDDPVEPPGPTAEEIHLQFVEEYLDSLLESTGEIDRDAKVKDIELGRKIANSVFGSDVIEAEFEVIKDTEANIPVLFPARVLQPEEEEEEEQVET